MPPVPLIGHQIQKIYGQVVSYAYLAEMRGGAAVKSTNQPIIWLLFCLPEPRAGDNPRKCLAN